MTEKAERRFYLKEFKAISRAIATYEDVTLLTLLPAPQIEGLQVLNRSNGKWIRLIAPPGSLIINSGDYIVDNFTLTVLP